MFKRQIDLRMISPINQSIELVNHENLEEHNLIVSFSINRYTYGQRDTMTVDVYNLSPRILGELYANKYFNGGIIQLDFGYEDEGTMFRLFEGNVQRAQLSREDAVTDCVTIYSYDCGNFANYGFFGKSYEDGYNMYRIAEDILNTSDYAPSYQLSERLKEFETNGATAYCGNSDKYLQNIASDCGLYYKKENNLAKILSPLDGGEEDVVYFTTDTAGKPTSMSGLIGIPQLNSDGLSLNCLINPKLAIYGLIYVDNSIISINQSGTVLSDVSMGATLSSNGLYRIVKMSINGSNNGERCSCSIKALAKDMYDNYTVSNSNIGKSVRRI